MATLDEINTLVNDPQITDRVRAAILVTALSVAFEGAAVENHATRLVWAKQALNDPNSKATEVARYVIGANATLPKGDPITPDTILGLTDAQLQSHVDASLLVFGV